MSFTCAVVVTFKAPEKLETCIASLKPRLSDIKIIDNSPPAENLLYTAGINKGIRQALREDADYVLVICDDVTVQDDCIDRLETFLDENPKCAIASPLQISKEGTVTCGGCTDAFPYGRHITEPLGHSLYEKPFEQYWANGACFLVRTEAIRECGLMDENMRFICSDSDWSFTMRARDWKCLLVPDARVTHEPDGALKYKNPFIERVKAEDALYFTKKWLIGGIFRDLAHEQPTEQEIRTHIQSLMQHLHSFES